MAPGSYRADAVLVFVSLYELLVGSEALTYASESDPIMASSGDEVKN